MAVAAAAPAAACMQWTGPELPGRPPLFSLKNSTGSGPASGCSCSGSSDRRSTSPAGRRTPCSRGNRLRSGRWSRRRRRPAAASRTSARRPSERQTRRSSRTLWASSSERPAPPAAAPPSRRSDPVTCPPAPPIPSPSRPAGSSSCALPAAAPSSSAWSGSRRWCRAGPESCGCSPAGGAPGRRRHPGTPARTGPWGACRGWARPGSAGRTGWGSQEPAAPGRSTPGPWSSPSESGQRWAVDTDGGQDVQIPAASKHLTRPKPVERSQGFSLKCLLLGSSFPVSLFLTSAFLKTSDRGDQTCEQDASV